MNSKKLTLTYSAKRDFLTCQRKYYYGYECQLTPNSTGSSLVIGNIIHQALAMLLGGQPLEEVQNSIDKHIKKSRIQLIGEDLDSFEKDSVVIVGLINAWNDHRGLLKNIKIWTYDKEPAVELQFELEIDNTLTMLGKCDGLCTKKDKKLWLLEHKSASNIGPDYIERLYVDWQTTDYIYAMEEITGQKIAGSLYNVLGKPGIRQKQKQSLAAFNLEMEQKIEQEATKYLYTTVLYKRAADVKLVPVIYRAVADQINVCRKASLWIQNDKECTGYMGCPFLSFCAHGQTPTTMANFHVRKERHPELV